jgi:UDP-N-acetylglucosamine/UDP-N-acetyl-alpha-D-glucosaminouronate 4-epimerase
LRDLLGRRDRDITQRQPEYLDFRPGDVRHSQADITQARQRLAYAPEQTLAGGLEATLSWYRKNLD